MPMFPVMADCTVCLDSYPLAEMINLASDRVCHSCIRYVFERAATNEEDFPPKWGSQILHVKDFDSVLPYDLRCRLRVKITEYQTPVAERIYCKNADPITMTDIGDEDKPCGKFVGRIVKDWERNVAVSAYPRVKCQGCETSYCLNCGDYFTTLHECQDPGPTKQAVDAFEGLEKGKDYQICPSDTCRRKIELRDGCNHVYCSCGTSLCFVCGTGDIRRNHWDRSREAGGCPRFGHPSRPNALYDSPVEPGRFFGPGGPDEGRIDFRNLARAFRRGAVADVGGFEGDNGGIGDGDRAGRMAQGQRQAAELAEHPRGAGDLTGFLIDDDLAVDEELSDDEDDWPFPPDAPGRAQAPETFDRPPRDEQRPNLFDPMQHPRTTQHREMADSPLRLDMDQVEDFDDEFFFAGPPHPHLNHASQTRRRPEPPWPQFDDTRRMREQQEEERQNRPTYFENLARESAAVQQRIQDHFNRAVRLPQGMTARDEEPTVRQDYLRTLQDVRERTRLFPPALGFGVPPEIFDRLRNPAPSPGLGPPRGFREHPDGPMDTANMHTELNMPQALPWLVPARQETAPAPRRARAAEGMQRRQQARDQRMHNRGDESMALENGDRFNPTTGVVSRGRRILWESASEQQPPSW